MVNRVTRSLVSFFGWMRPEAILLISFGIAILTGGLLLSLPFSHYEGVGLSDAFFTAASAVCVTGLIVVDTGSDYTVSGQIIILILIQLGGLGVMTFAALVFELLGSRLSLAGQAAMTQALVHEELVKGFQGYFKKILYLLVTIELIGAAALFFAFLPETGPGEAAYTSVFHSVSAFCNAGFSLYPDSLIGFDHNLILVGIVAALIIVGGIGHPVIFDIIRVFREPNKNNKSLWSQFNTHTRITVITTIILLVSGTVLLFFSAMPVQVFDPSEAVFQSITARTAGFNTVVTGNLPLSSLIILLVLMFIGGSPGSCAGGIKTTTFAIWMGQLFNRLKGKKATIIGRRYMPQTLVRRSSTIIGLAVLWNIAGVFILSLTEAGTGLHHIMFEQVSAFGTVGLSTGLTPELSEYGRVWVILTMFVGRTGPLTGVILLLKRKPVTVKYPEGKVMIG
ncbi:MAG: TrkH family potassium uptake protein [Chitinivibrionales bacterium]